MAPTAAQIAQLRRMVAEPTVTTYSDAALTTFIETYKCLDERGTAPYWLDVSTEPPTETANVDWVPTYDLNAAAADIWAEKAGTLASNFDFSADGGNYSRSQAYEQAMKQSRYYSARRQPGTSTSHVWPSARPRPVWIGNLAEPSDG